MAEQEARPQSPAAPRRSGGGRGFIAGLVGGVLGAGGSIYALQIPEVRENLPLPPQAELIVNPEAVARISALEEELAGLRIDVREAEESATLDTVRARLEQLSREITTTATVAQLAELRDSLGPLATPEGAAVLDERLAALESGVDDRVAGLRQQLDELGGVAARRSSLAALEAAVDGNATRMGNVESELADLTERTTALQELGTDLDERASAIADRVAADETALVERGAALVGRLEALAAGVAGFREALGSADARIAQLQETAAEELAAMRASIQALEGESAAAIAAIADRSEATAAQTEELRAAVAAIEQDTAAFRAETEERIESFASAVEARLGEVNATLESARVASEAAVAGAQEEAASATAAAEAARETVAQALARARAAAGVTAAAGEVGAALATGGGRTAATTTLDGVARDTLDEAERARLGEARGVLVEHADGVASATALQRGFDRLRPAVVEAAAPAGGDGSGSLMGRFGVRERGVSAAVAQTLSAMESALAAGDVGAAIDATQQLPIEARDVLQGWIDTARARLAVSDARASLLDLGRELAATAGAS